MLKKHSEIECAWGSDIPEIRTTLEILVDKIEKDTAHRAEVDDQQFALIREHTGQIGGLQSDVKHLDKRINNAKGNRVAAVPSPACSEPSLWQAIKKIKKVWFLFIFVGGTTLLTLFADILLQIGAWLKEFASSIGG